MIDEQKALELIAQGEGQHVEFKESVPSKVRELSEEACAFSNASGGFIFIGINNKNEFVKGFAIENSKRSSIQDSLDAIQPAATCEFYPLTVQGHSIWVIEVPEGENKPFEDAGAIHFDASRSKELRPYE